MTSPKKNTQQTFSISQLAAQLDISPRAIRFYEEKGLISPRRTPGNQRIYTPKDRARLKLILRGKRFGFSLDEIAEMIGMAHTDLDEVSQIQKSLDYGRRKLQEIRERMRDLVLLEQDLLAVQKKLERRLEELQREEKP
ncbi:DNA-binding transcriptional regulator, MerR family [Desulfacinum hydrothermale DSM 13146]|uniref:DNA-binding transcriptional regulator, MerR family n=1 Tax=Desulfacinum hydrothermale DSM 13146 TaxID=1121390 RepID=A0A1W1WZU1_9BACT|nr:MerR family DNA-binding transcriptional regulator [Desulfacinum hydrothermale]SMC17050.1 DNA-binding transcriptional regulator, MerR family [Desulfacinum hydrothermale DSM 13146]